MQNNTQVPQQPLFVRIVIWLMVFLMSVGFVFLVILPFAGNVTLFGGANDTRGQTLELRTEAREKVQADDCANEKNRPKGARLERCKLAVGDLAAAYRTLTVPEQPTTEEEAQQQPEIPKGYKDNLRMATELYELLYELDTKDRDSIQDLAGWYRDQGRYEDSIPLWEALVKRYPKDSQYLLQLAVAQQYSGKTDLAKASYQEFIEKFPDRETDVESVEATLEQIAEQEKAAAEGGGGLGGLSGLEGLNIS